MTKALTTEQLRASLAERFIQASPLAITDVAEDIVESDADLTPPPGTITLFFARDPGVLEELDEALGAADGDALVSLRSRAEEARRPLPESDDAARQTVSESATVFDVRYGGRTVVASHILPEGELLGSVTMSWTGGRLDDAAFTIVEYAGEERTGQELTYRAYRRAPELTDLERSMLERVPPELSEMNLGSILASETRTMEEVAMMVQREAQHAVETRTCGPDNLDALQQLIEDAVISPEASVRELVRARLDLITQSRLRRGYR